MTVKELIEALSKMPPDAEVLIHVDGFEDQTYDGERDIAQPIRWRENEVNGFVIL